MTTTFCDIAPLIAAAVYILFHLRLSCSCSRRNVFLPGLSTANVILVFLCSPTTSFVVLLYSKLVFVSCSEHSFSIRCCFHCCCVYIDVMLFPFLDISFPISIVAVAAYISHMLPSPYLRCLRQRRPLQRWPLRLQPCLPLQLQSRGHVCHSH